MLHAGWEGGGVDGKYKMVAMLCEMSDVHAVQDCGIELAMCICVQEDKAV